MQHQQHGIRRRLQPAVAHQVEHGLEDMGEGNQAVEAEGAGAALDRMDGAKDGVQGVVVALAGLQGHQVARSEEHTSELQSLMRISYAVFCLKNKTKQRQQ